MTAVTEGKVARRRAQVREQIVEAARVCFGRGGLLATKMDEIADEAGILRPNLYRYFPSKDSLIVEVIVAEMRTTHEARRATLPMTGPVRPLIVESLVMGAEISRTEDAIKTNMAVEAIQLTARLCATEQRVLDAQYEYWGPLLEYGRARREINPGLSNERIVRWFLSQHFGFFERPEFFGGPDGIPGYINDFVVPPVLADPTTAL
jgi:AcrR family transcriptional regulator